MQAIIKKKLTIQHPSKKISKPIFNDGSIKNADFKWKFV